MTATVWQFVEAVGEVIPEHNNDSTQVFIEVNGHLFPIKGVKRNEASDIVIVAGLHNEK